MVIALSQSGWEYDVISESVEDWNSDCRRLSTINQPEVNVSCLLSWVLAAMFVWAKHVQCMLLNRPDRPQCAITMSFEWSLVMQCLSLLEPGILTCLYKLSHPGRQARNIDQMLIQCWPAIYDDGPPLIQHWISVGGAMFSGILVPPDYSTVCQINTVFPAVPSLWRDVILGLFYAGALVPDRSWTNIGA